MSRLSIEMTEQQHQSIKALAAMQGKSIKEYAMQRLLPLTADEENAMQELEAFLAARLEEARQDKFVDKSVMQIAEETIKRMKERQ